MYLIPNIKNLFAFTAMFFFFSTSLSWGGESSLDSIEIQSLQIRVSSSHDDAEELANGRMRLKSLQEDGTYQGEISHLGTWSLNKPVEDASGIYRSRIIYENGDPATTVKGYHYTDKYEAICENTVPAIASGEIVEI